MQTVTLAEEKAMANRLATPLGTESEILVFEELLVAQDDIWSIGKSVDTLLMELDQQTFEAYLSSNSEGSAASRTRRTLKTGSQMLSPVHATNNSSAKQSPEALEPRRPDPPAVIEDSSPAKKRNRNVERRQLVELDVNRRLQPPFLHLLWT